MFVCFQHFESYNLLGTNRPERTSTARKFFSGLRGKPFRPRLLRSSGRVSTIYGSAGI